MTTLLSLILITSILVLGWTIATQPNMILHSVRAWAENKNKDGWVLAEPLFLCQWCQPSIWSSLGYLFAFGTGIVDVITWRTLLMYPLVVCGSSLVCGIVWAVYKKIEIQIKHLDNLEQMSHWDVKDRKKKFSQRPNSNL